MGSEPRRWSPEVKGRAMREYVLALLPLSFLSTLYYSLKKKKNPKQKTYFIELWLTCKWLYILNAYNLMGLEIRIHLWNHHHNLCHKPIHHQQFPPAFLFIIILWYKHYSLSRSLSIHYSMVNSGSMLCSGWCCREDSTCLMGTLHSNNSLLSLPQLLGAALPLPIAAVLHHCT